MIDLIGKFEKYLDTDNTIGEHFIDNIWIRSNKYYIFFGEENKMGKTYAMFSKKYLMTIELTKDKGLELTMDRIAEVVDIVREKKGVKIEKHQFWLPHWIQS